MSNLKLQSPIGLIAGSGSLPIEFAQSAQAKGFKVVALAHVNETSPELAKYVSEMTWIKLGQLGKVVRVLKKAGVKQATFAGGIKKPNFAGMKLDIKGFFTLIRIRSFHDDALLRGISKEMERCGIQIFSAGELLENNIPKSGPLTLRNLKGKEIKDALMGWRAAEAVGKCDIGQTVVVNEKVVVAVEALEGTDACLQRAYDLRGAGATVVKLCKVNQDRRFDLPAVGVATIENMQRIGATALVLRSEGAMLIQPMEVVNSANKANIAIVAFESDAEIEKLL